MTTHERFTRAFYHREPDRVPILDSPWRGTIKRWHREGMPEGVDYIDYFDLDRVTTVGLDNSPRYPVRVLEDTDTYQIATTPWGVTLRNWKEDDSTPEFLDFTITGRAEWAEAKERMVPTKDRIPWEHLEREYRRWREEGHWIVAGLWFGFDVTHSWAVGTERLLMALIEDPEWCIDMFNTFLDVDLALLDMMWEAGYEFDCVRWPDDMGYKHSQFFSVSTYKDLVKPVHERAIRWAHEHGVKTELHSCGDVNPFVPELVEIGLDALNPLEVKAGVDPGRLKQRFGRDLVFHGGINAVLWDDPDAISAEIERVVPVMKQSGGYVFASDHSIPNTVSLEAFRNIISLVKRVGSYA